MAEQLKELKCQRCGGQLDKRGNIYVCSCCGRTFENREIINVADQLRGVLSEQNNEKVANLKQLLWKEIHKEFVSDREVERLCKDILNYNPEDFYAKFYLATCSDRKGELSAFLSDLNVDEIYADIPDMLDYLIRGLKDDWTLCVGNFIERAYKSNDIKLYNEYRTRFEAENDKIDECVYEPTIFRDVFIAYSSADMAYVESLVSAIESEDFTCFVAARNLRHGSGSVENYVSAIHTAIEHCSVLVFVSSQNSRSNKCDAYKELNYIEQNRKSMPRIEYLINDYTGRAVERYFKGFFSGLEYCTSKEEVLNRVCDKIMGGSDEAKKAEEQRKHREEEERKRLEQARKEEQERLRHEEEERNRLEAERKSLEQARKDEEARKLREEKERKRKEEQERLQREEEERQRVEVNKALSKIGDYKDIGGGYVTFGTYPQSKKAGNVQIGKIFDNERGYYIGSDNNLYAVGNGKFYKVEPIKWKVLSSGSELFLVSDMILDAHRFDKDSNNYANSEIRSWLNGEFYNKAFSQSQKNKIVTTTVDNSLSSTGDKENEYVCGDTNDKVFLLSHKEAERYFTSKVFLLSRKKADLQREGTDYAKARGLYVYNGNGKSWWWLRSPYCGNSNAKDVHFGGGFFISLVNINDHGVLPALKIRVD